MAKIPEMTDLTLMAIDMILEEKQALESERNYLGMSQIGEECWRKLFYSFRGATKRKISASGIKAIQDGFLQEDIMAERLRLLPFIELITVVENGEQIGFSLVKDHFRGHADGMIKGIKEAPKSWHVWENKAVNETKFKKLISLKNELSEKLALVEWDIIYYAQAQIYMYCAKVERHYLTVETPGGRDAVSCRTEIDSKYVQGIIEKATIIITDNWNIPAKLSENREFYKCKWCEFSGICHDGDIPLLNCKTCRYSEPIEGGERICNLNETILQPEKYSIGCSKHIYNPALLPARLIEQQADGCIYETNNGFKFANMSLSGLPELKGELDEIFTSKDLVEKIKNVNNLTKKSVEIQKSFNGEFQSKEKKAWNSTVDPRLTGL